jgi:hypothetical protein
MEALLALLPGKLDSAGFARCTAQFRSCLSRIDPPMEWCQKSASNDESWATTSTNGNDIANARNEINNALAA